MQYAESFTETIKAFANNVFNADGGTHLTGFRSALTRVVNDYARKNGLIKDKEENLSGPVTDGEDLLINVLRVALYIPDMK